VRCLVNCNVLTTGFDAPNVDLVALVRATLSAGLYVQMVGRGTRLSDGKDDCLILDYGQNVQRHGFIDQVKAKRQGEGGDGEAPAKQCPDCQEMMPTATRLCPACGHEFPPPALNHGNSAYGGAVMSSQVVAEWVDVDHVDYARHKKQGKPDSVKVTYHCGLKSVSEWLCPDHGGYAASRYSARKPALGADADNTEDALAEAPLSWKVPTRIKIKPRVSDPRFDEIVQLDYSAGRKPKPQGQELSWDGGGDDDWDEIPF